jgi:hypothetical protein
MQGAGQVARQVSVLHSHPSIKVHAYIFQTNDNDYHLLSQYVGRPPGQRFVTALKQSCPAT